MRGRRESAVLAASLATQERTGTLVDNIPNGITVEKNTIEVCELEVILYRLY
jgi:hypothetical protein